MFLIQEKINLKTVLFALTFIYICFTFLYKLDYHYFFTDEILNAKRGLDNIQGNYQYDAHVPLVPKYFSGIIYQQFGRNALYLRLPYAIVGILTAYVLFKIISNEHGTYLGLLGALLFTTSKIIFNASRMMMLEPLMHISWLIFLYLFYITLKNLNKKYLIYTGIAFGFALNTKVTSVTLIAFSILISTYLIFKNRDRTKEILNILFTTYLFASLVFLITYIHYFLTLGIKTGIVKILKETNNVYFKKSVEGKMHVINNSIYYKSPYWSYTYFFISNNKIIRTIWYVITAPFSLFKNNFFDIYWSTFFIIVLAFMQLSGVKNARYISSFEIPLIILSVSGINHLYNKIKSKRVLALLTVLFLTTFILIHMQYLIKLQPTEFLGVFNHYKKVTNDFSKNDRMYIFGSIRTMKWYRRMLPDQDLIVYRRDYNIMCKEFNDFKYFVFDKEELLMDPDNLLHKYVNSSTSSFEYSDVAGMLWYEKKDSSNLEFNCPVIEP